MNLNDEDVFRVERIVAYNADEDLFHVKWEGYDASENTWEPRENLTERLVNEWFDASAKSSEKTEGTDNGWLVDDTADDKCLDGGMVKRATPPKETLKSMVEALANTHFTPPVAKAVQQYQVWGLKPAAPPVVCVCACCGLLRTTAWTVWMRNDRVRIGSVCASKLKWLIPACKHIREIESAEAQVSKLLSGFISNFHADWL